MITLQEPSVICPLCGRLLANPQNKHHLIPVSKGGAGTPTLMLHKICHDKIHSVISEKELKHFYHTMERLQQYPELEKFIKWLQNKPPEFYDGSAKKKK